MDPTNPFDRVAGLITSPLGVAVVCVGIVAWALVAYLTFRVRIAPIIRELRSTIRKLSETTDSQGFAEEFEEYNESVRRSPVLQHIWHEFDETLIKLPDSEPPAIRNTRGAGDYFTQAAVVGNRLNLRFYSALPNLLTGSGILGTFIGLLAGIWLASKGLISPNHEIMMNSVKNLLHGASLAFSTSIAGLITSILFSWREKHWIHKLQSLRGRWVNMLDSRLDRVNSELLNHELLVENRDQTAVLKSFTSELAFQIADAFQEKMSTSLTPLLERLVTAVENMRVEQQQSNNTALQSMVQEFSESLAGTAGQQLADLAETLSDVNVKLTGLTEKFDKSITNIGRSLDKATELAEKYDGIISQTETALTSVKDVSDALSGIVDPISSTATRFGETSTEMQGVAEKILETSSGLSQAVVDIKGMQDDIKVVWQNYQTRFESVDKDLAKVFEELETGLGRYTQTVNDFVKKLDKHTSSIVSDLAGASSELNSSIEELTDTLGRD